MMRDEQVKSAIGVPQGYVAIPIDGGGGGALLRLCVLVREKADPVAGRLTVLRDSADASVLLGCITDAAGRVQDWVELWIQQVPSSSNSIAAFRDALTNSVLDDRWKRRAEAWDRADAAAVIRTGWELAHPAPMFIDAAAGKALSPAAGKEQAWSLCEDDALLSRKGLPPYTRSLHRYLYVRGGEESYPLVPVTEGAPQNAATKTLDDIMPPRADLLAINAGAGLLSVRRYSPLSLENFADLLSGAPWEGVRQGRAVIDPGGVGQTLRRREGDASADGWLSIEPANSSTFVLEALHLKLRLVADVVEAVREFVKQSQRPLLELTPDSFSVRLGEPGIGLPFLWTARVALVDAGDSVPLPLPIAGAQYFASPRPRNPSLYRAPIVGRLASGRGTVRVPNVTVAAEGQVVVDLTLTTDEDIRPSPSDLVRFRLNLGSARMDLFARLDPDAPPAVGEWRFRSLRHRAKPETIVNLKEAQGGVEMPNVLFELLPLLNTPCDLYSLAAIATRTLLVSPRATLAQSMDKIRSLSAQSAGDGNGGGLVERIASVFSKDARWNEWLGPHHLVRDETRIEQIAHIVPPALWYDCLAAIVRMFPGPGPEKACRDYGDVPAAGIHKVFDRASADLQSLVMRTRSLVVMDTRQNREMRQVIAKVISTLGREAGVRRMVPQS